MKRNKWIELYHSALLEMADAEARFPDLSRSITVAQDAMEARRRELENDHTHALERKALDHAMNNLQSAAEDLAGNAPLGQA
jgi:hypothetical protein